MKRILIAVLVLTAVLAVQGCASTYRSGPDTRSAADPKLGRTTYYEEGRLVFLAVDTRATAAVKDGTVIPLAFMLVNKSDGTLRVHSENFTLVDGDGNRFPLLPYETYRGNYRRMTLDRKLSEPFYEATNQHLSIDGSFLSPFRPQPLLFYGQGGPRSDSLELGPKRYTRGFLYFTMPDEERKGKPFELHMTSQDLPDAVYVRFFID